jgi:RNA polymerase sigma factor for flagellar operon FliA
MPVSTALSNPERDRLILSHLPQVRMVASQVHSKCPRQVEIEDLVSVGVIGLMQAIDRFDASRGLLLKTLADYRIRGAMLDYLRQLDPLPRSVRRFVRQRAEAALRLTLHLGREPEEFELAQELGLSITRMRKLECVARAGQVRSLEEADTRRLAA